MGHGPPLDLPPSPFLRALLRPNLRAAQAQAKAKAKAKGGGKGKSGKGKCVQEESFTDFRVDDWRHLPADPAEAVGAAPKGIQGHCVVSHDAQLWCIGGARPDASSPQISLLLFDLHRRCWSDMTPKPSESAPSWRWGHSSVVVPAQYPPQPGTRENLLLLCGGFDKETNMNDVWYFCPQTGQFFQPRVGMDCVPVLGAYHSLAYDIATDEAYLFGGQKCVQGKYEFYDTLIKCGLNCGSWLIVHTRGARPPERGQHACAISNRVLVLHGGSNRYKLLRDVWTLKLDASTPHWSEVKIQGPSLWVGKKQKAVPYQIAPCRPFLASGDGILVLGRGKPPKEDHPGDLSLWALSLQRRRWRRVPVEMPPAWAGNFAASFHEGGAGNVLLVLGGERMGSSAVAGTGTPLCEGGLWSIDLAARPSKLLLLTLQKALRSGSVRFSEDVLRTIFGFSMGRLTDMIAHM
mmetsp:Transcript_2964/g.6708  ORF Transcript_2964/g.6708 Transcript_2964/m.6708 type:complete len:462 (-) Transcript_2964:102-1487(-)